MRTRTLLAVLAGAIIAALLARGGGLATPPPSDAAAPATARPDAARRPAPPPRVVPAALDPDLLTASAMREALADYERLSVYPPTSHLHTEETAGQNPPWNQAFPVELPLDDRPGRETVSRFVADRHHVEYGEALTSTIEVWPATRPTERLPVTIRSAIVEGLGQGRTGVTLTYRDDGQGGDRVAGDRVYTARLVPSEHAALATAAQVRVQAEIEAGGVERLLHLDFTYTPRPLLELVAVDVGARDGALAIDIDLVVHEPGHYQLYADVLAADGETPIGWITGHWTRLDEGRRRASLALFGKVLHDRGLPGPYVIANLRGVRRGDEAEAEMWWSDPRTFRSPAVALDAFSPAPWDGPEKRETIATLERTIAELEEVERGGAPAR